MSKKENSDRASDLDVEKTEHHAVFNDKVEAHRGGDEALRVLEHHAQEAPISPEEEKRLVRRIDYWMMPIMCITYGLQYIDKASLSIAAIFGIVQDLGLFRITGFRNGAPVIDTGRYSNVAMIFYVGYLVGAYPLAAIAQRLPAAKCCAIYVALWGLCSTLTPLCKDYKGMMVQRFFLGFLESGVSPAFLLMTGMWYRKEEVALRTAWWYSFTGFSVIVSIPISIGFLKIDSSLAPWQIIFYWWGAITIAWGLVVFLLLPDSPITAKFLSERERYVAIERLRANQAGLENKKFKGYQVLEALTDYKVWLLFAISFLLSAPNGAVSTFTPLVIKTFTASPYRTAVLTIPGGVTSFVSVVLSGYIASTWRGVRTYVLLFFCIPTLIGSSLLWKAGLSNRTAMLAGLYLQPTFSAAYVQVLAFAVSNVAGYTKKAVVSGLIFIAYCCGNIAGPLFFKAHEAPLYPSGFEATVTVTALGFGLAVVYRTILYFENKKRDNAGPATGRDLAFDDVTDKENPRFRYSL